MRTVYRCPDCGHATCDVDDLEQIQPDGRLACGLCESPQAIVVEQIP